MNYKKTIYKIRPLPPHCNSTQSKILSKNTKKEKPDLQKSVFLYSKYPNMHPREIMALLCLLSLYPALRGTWCKLESNHWHMEIHVQRSSSPMIRALNKCSSPCEKLSPFHLLWFCYDERNERGNALSAQLGCLGTGGRPRLRVPPVKNQSVISS